MDKHFEPVTAKSLAKEVARLGTGPNFRNIEHYINSVEKLLEPHIRKPSDDDKSVPARCEEAYNGAINLLAAARDLFVNMNSKRGNSWVDMYRHSINKPNPFKEADIVKEDEAKPTLLPFSLEDAKNGARVVTRGGDSVKILCDDLYGPYPIIAVVTRKNGNKVSMTTTLDGKSVIALDGINDLFILKEPETIDLSIFRHKEDGSLDVITRYESYMNRDKWEFIKTITVTI